MKNVGRNKMNLRDEINKIDVEINNLTIRKELLLKENVYPIAQGIINDLRTNKEKIFDFTFSVDNLSWDGDNFYYVINIRFPNVFSFKERLRYKHKIIEYIHSIFKEL